MKNYKSIITLNKNNRGCYILDTVKGCILSNNSGCYGDCYAYKIAKRYGYDFINPIKRNFDENNLQLNLFGYNVDYMQDILYRINKIDMPFIRIGEMGDPSQYWEHTCKIIELIGNYINKKIVIITKHINKISDECLKSLSKFNVIVNTSISALDDKNVLENKIIEYNRLKNYIKSILRIVTCEFNKNNSIGYYYNEIQKKIIDCNFIDTVFRPSKNNYLVINNIINTENIFFLNKKILASINNKKTYFGKCENCVELCGITK